MKRKTFRLQCDGRTHAVWRKWTKSQSHSDHRICRRHTKSRSLHGNNTLLAKLSICAMARQRSILYVQHLNWPKKCSTDHDGAGWLYLSKTDDVGPSIVSKVADLHCRGSWASELLWAKKAFSCLIVALNPSLIFASGSGTKTVSLVSLTAWSRLEPKRLFSINSRQFSQTWLLWSTRHFSILNF